MSDERLYLRTERRRITWPAHAGGASEFREADPPASLRGRVAKLRWGYECLPIDVPVRERIVADGTMHLLVDFGPARPRALVLGPSTAPAVIQLQGRVEQLGVELRPGALAAWFGVPARELAGQEVALEDLWGARAAELIERLCEAPDVNARFAAVADMLASHAEEAHPGVTEALRRINITGGQIRVGELAAGVGLSDRRLQQLFDVHVGLSPKAVSRLARFRAAVDRLAGGRQSWAEIAAACGFSDQSHLVNDFRAFTGLSPGVLLRRAGFGFLQD